MGILRTDILSHSQLPDGNQSVEFDGTGDYLQVPASAAWRLGSANLAHKSVTIEWWVYLNSLSSHAAFGLNALSGIIAFGTSGRYAIYAGGQTLINESNSVLDAVGLNEWHHYALVLHGGGAGEAKNVEFYRDGKLSVSNTYAANVAVGDSTHVLTIGVDQENNSSYLNGFISNFRWSDEIVYPSEFTVPKFKLKALPSTMLLCCQSSTSVTEAAVSVSGSVTSNGDPAVSAFGPGLKDDITDTGVVFDGVTTFDSQAFMVPPSGKTTERNRGRGFFASGFVNPTQSNVINFLNIQSSGNTEDFGDLTVAKYAIGSGASSTRGIFHGGYLPSSSPDTDINSIEFITIASTGNATEFGDRTVVGRNPSAASSSTRVVMAAGHPSPNSYTDTIDFITTATTGNASDFGNLLSATNAMCNANNSPTRGIFSGGNQPSSPYNQNVIQFVTMASTGDATDFGDLTVKARDAAGGTASSNTRGLILIGNSNPNNNLNTVDFITMASAGNASDFGDLFTGRYSVSSCSNSNRAVFLAGRTTSPSIVYQNAMEFVTISTTGNTSDFGDIIGSGSGSSAGAANSDSHGGL